MSYEEWDPTQSGRPFYGTGSAMPIEAAAASAPAETSEARDEAFGFEDGSADEKLATPKPKAPVVGAQAEQTYGAPIPKPSPAKPAVLVVAAASQMYGASSAQDIQTAKESSAEPATVSNANAPAPPNSSSTASNAASTADQSVALAKDDGPIGFPEDLLPIPPPRTDSLVCFIHFCLCCSSVALPWELRL